jgi:pyruvate/2-oxoglutarate/acetoin dehydrogenase E1 component
MIPVMSREQDPAHDGKPPPFGKSAVVRKGSDVTIIGQSIDVIRCVKAAAELANEAIEVEFIDLRTLTPLDSDTICESVGKTARLVVADECYLAQLLKMPANRLNFPAVPVPLSLPLELHLLPRVDKIITTTKELDGW